MNALKSLARTQRTMILGNLGRKHQTWDNDVIFIIVSSFFLHAWSHMQFAPGDRYIEFYHGAPKLFNCQV